MSERFSNITTAEEARQLLEELRNAGILKGEPGVYMLDEETPTDTDTTDETESRPESESEADWSHSKPAVTTAMPIVMALVKATALAGTVYMAYRTSRRLGIDPVRF